MIEDPDKADDETLVQLALADTDCFGHLVSRYQARMQAYVRRISGFSDQDIQDLLQEVFIKVYKHLNDFDRQLKFSNWLYRIVHNEVINHYRKTKSTLLTLGNIRENNTIFFGTREEPTAEQIVLDQELTTNLHNLISLLSIEHREILVLKYLEDRTYQEISDILKKPVGTVANLIHRAQRKLKKELLKRGINGPSSALDQN